MEHMCEVIIGARLEPILSASRDGVVQRRSREYYSVDNADPSGRVLRR